MAAHISEHPPGKRMQTAVPHWVLGFTLSGRCEHGPPAGSRFSFGAGEVLLIQPRMPMSWRVVGEGNWRVVSCFFQPRPHWLPWLDWPAVARGFRKLALSASAVGAVGDCFRRAVAHSASGHADASDLAAHAVEEALLLCRRDSSPSSAQGDERVRAAIADLSTDLAVTRSLDGLARACGLSRAQLVRRFRAETGSSPMAYLAQLRLRRASQLLRLSDLPIKGIARAVGFADQRHFASWFRQMAGTTPSAHRALTVRTP